jgi:hypothetical protein
MRVGPHQLTQETISAEETPDRIGRVSLLVQVLALLFLVVLPAYHLMSWFAVDGWLQTHLAHRGVHVPVDEIAGSNRVFAFLVQTVPLAIALLVLFWLQRLFAGYRRGEVFTLSSIGRFQAMARMLFLFTIVNPLAGALVSVIVTAGRPDGQWIVVGFGTPEIAALIAGGVLAAIGWVMVEAKRLADDNTQIV